MEANERQSHEQETKLQEKITSLTANLEEAKEQQVNLQPFKEHVLAQKAKMLQLQTAIEDERCRVLQIDGRLEEILETSSYFVDRSQDILEVIKARMARLEDNDEVPVELPSKDQQTLKQDHDLLEFSINTIEEFKKAIRKTKGACTKFFRRLLITYNRCQVEAEQRMDAFPDHNLFVEILQRKYQEDERRIQHIKDLDEQTLRSEVYQSMVSMHLLED